MIFDNSINNPNDSLLEEKPDILLSDKQQILLKHLLKIDQKLERMFMGALVVLKQNENPHKIQQSAYSMRELLGNIGKKSLKYEGIDTKEYKLVVKVTNLKEKWNISIRNTGCYKEDNKWIGNIDVHLNKLLDSLETFFNEYQKNRPTPKENFPVIKKHLDPLCIPLPNILYSLNAEKWRDFIYYFNNVLHHNISVEYSDFSKKMREFEDFMLDLCQPETYEDIEEIDSILEEE